MTSPNNPKKCVSDELVYIQDDRIQVRCIKCLRFWPVNGYPPTCRMVEMNTVHLGVDFGYPLKEKAKQEKEEWEKEFDLEFGALTQRLHKGVEHLEVHTCTAKCLASVQIKSFIRSLLNQMEEKHAHECHDHIESYKARLTKEVEGIDMSQMTTGGFRKEVIRLITEI